MTTIHLSRDERLTSILKAASDIIMESGIEATTVTAVATRSGVSRQWLYDFFPDVEGILRALYVEAQDQYFNHEPLHLPGDADFTAYVKRNALAWLQMPVPFAMLTSYALNGGSRHATSSSTLRSFILEHFERSYVDPLVAFGYARAVLYGSIMTIINTALGLNVAVAEGLTTYEVAEQRLFTVIDAILATD
jgi:AcrR family transcriptional regulator